MSTPTPKPAPATLVWAFVVMFLGVLTLAGYIAYLTLTPFACGVGS